MGRGREVGFINVSVFGKAGEAAAEYLAKGWLVAVDGRLELGQWETDGGEKRHDYKVVGNVEFLTAPRPAEEPEPAKAGPQRQEGRRCLVAVMARTRWPGAGPRGHGRRLDTSASCHRYAGFGIIMSMRSADLLVAGRRRAGLSQEQLAERLGRTQSTIARWETRLSASAA